MKRVELDKSQNVTPPPLESLRLNGLNVAVIGGTGGIGRALSHQFWTTRSLARSITMHATSELQPRRTATALWEQKAINPELAWIRIIRAAHHLYAVGVQAV